MREDPIVAFRLVRWGLSDTEMAVALTPDRTAAWSLISWLHGPYTSGDIDLRPIRRSEMRVLKRNARAA